MLTYMGTVDDFDQNLPVVNQMSAFSVPDSSPGSDDENEGDDNTEGDSEGGNIF